MTKILYLSIFLLFSTLTFSQAGNLDNSFNGDGIDTFMSRYSGTNKMNDAHCVAVQSDGKVIVGGEAINTSNIFEFAIYRYNIDGTLDNSFGTNGITTTMIGTRDNFSRAIIIQKDGKILLGGHSWLSTTSSVFAIVRYLPDGKIDSSFGFNGIAKSTVNNLENRLSRMIELENGDIYLYGSSNFNLKANHVIFKFKANGIADNTFGNNGFKYYNQSNLPEIDGDIVYHNNKFYIGGESYLTRGSKFIIFRIDKDGIVDNSFGNNGIFTFGVKILFNTVLVNLL